MSEHTQETKKRFQDLVFVAAEVTSVLIPNCSLIHFEVPSKSQETYIGKVLWCYDAKKKQLIDWTTEKISIQHCRSYWSDLCDMRSQESDYCNFQRTISEPRNLHENFYEHKELNNYADIIRWKANVEAECFSQLPRDADQATEYSDEPRVISQRDIDSHRLLVYYVNEAWESLCGYAKEEIMGKSLSVLQGSDTDMEVVTILDDAILNSFDVSALIKNYKKNGESFMNRLRIVPLALPDKGSDNGSECNLYLATLQAVRDRTRGNDLTF